MTAIASLDPAVEWLLHSDEPLIRYRALVDLLEVSHDDSRVIDARRAIPNGPIVSALLPREVENVGSMPHPYRKWTGGHWRLVSLMDLGVPPEIDSVRPTVERIFGWLTSKSHLSNVPVIAGLPRRWARRRATRWRSPSTSGSSTTLAPEASPSPWSGGSGRTAAGTATGARRRIIRRSMRPSRRCADWPPTRACPGSDGLPTRLTARPNSFFGTGSYSRNEPANRSERRPSGSTTRRTGDTTSSPASGCSPNPRTSATREPPKPSIFSRRSEPTTAPGPPRASTTDRPAPNRWPTSSTGDEGCRANRLRSGPCSF